jgi:hypothetical protein
METELPRLPSASDRASAQRVADTASILLADVARNAETSMIEADPRWRSRAIKWLNDLASSGMGSVNVRLARASLELNTAVRVRLLEETLSSAPQNKEVLSALIVDYPTQHRWDDAIQVTRKLKDLTASEDMKQILDHNISAYEAVREAELAATAGR